jgi:hypothetical protein
MVSRRRDKRLQIMLSADELFTLDEFRFRCRLPSRAAAIRELLRRGLHAPASQIVATHAASKDFGVLKTIQQSGQHNEGRLARDRIHALDVRQSRWSSV